MIKKALRAAMMFAAQAALLLLIAIEAPQIHGKVIRYMVSDKVSYVIVPHLDKEQTVSFGTGFNLTMPSGKVQLITNRHVCEGSRDGYVFVKKQESVTQYRRKILKISRVSDLCLVQPLEGDEGLKLAGGVEVGDKVISVGHPDGLPLMASYGEAVGVIDEAISKVLSEDELNLGKCRWDNSKITDDKDDDGKPVKVCTETEPSLLTSCEVVGGSSGSPLFNIYGSVVGVVYASGANDWAYAIPLSVVKRFIKDE